jgi:hypothetical protein
MSMWGSNPIGVGLNRFKKEIGNSSSHKGFDAHNFYVLTLAECGPQGLATLLFLFYTLWQLTKFVRAHAPPEDPEHLALALGFTVAVICTALGGIYGSPTLEGAVMAPFWALCGLLERYTRLKMKGGDTPQGPKRVTIDSIEERFPLAAHR